VLVGLADGEVGGEPVEVDGGLDGAGRVARVLRQQGGYDAGEQVAAAALGHGGVAGGVDRYAAVRMGDERARALDLLKAKYRQYRETTPPGAVVALDIERWRMWP